MKPTVDFLRRTIMDAALRNPSVKAICDGAAAGCKPWGPGMDSSQVAALIIETLQHQTERLQRTIMEDALYDTRPMTWEATGVLPGSPWRLLRLCRELAIGATTGFCDQPVAGKGLEGCGAPAVWKAEWSDREGLACTAHKPLLQASYDNDGENDRTGIFWTKLEADAWKRRIPDDLLALMEALP